MAKKDSTGYDRIIEYIFRKHFERTATQFEFVRREIIEAK